MASSVSIARSTPVLAIYSNKAIALTVHSPHPECAIAIGKNQDIEISLAIIFSGAYFYGLKLNFVIYICQRYLKRKGV
ncbi:MULTISPECIES: hypothetical protein [Cyanophyceae]|uniref:hypothetical protein n=1 Tax=Cyanophyceae TaxID=3028117 RepID=UPI001685703B|nr:hypothetical protein [Trichocoleus sp. FACHB-69]MBD1930503.1 hypothetical protein [Trichocoleus sp. FACHB-69]